MQSVVARGPARTTIGSAALSPDGQWLVVGHAGGEPGPISADLFKIGNPKPAVRLQHRDAVCDVAFDPSSARVATASWDGTARVWSVAGGKPLTPPLRHRGAVNAVRFSPDGRRVLTGGQSGEVQLWDATSGESIAKFEHRLAVVEVAFDAVGGAIVSRAKDGSLRRWTVPLETRDVALLRELAEGWSGLQIDPIGGLVPVDPGASRLSE